MSAPRTVRLDLQTFSLDSLAALARHSQASAAVRRSFAAALGRWVQTRVATVTRTMACFDDADRDDIAQEFLIACLSRHLRQWCPERSPLAGFLFIRLRGAVIDAWRRRSRSLRRDPFVDVDLAYIVDPASELEGGERVDAREFDDRCEALRAAVVELPRRQRAVVEHLLRGETLTEAATALRVHPSTASRECGAALAQLRAALDPASTDSGQPARRRRSGSRVRSYSARSVSTDGRCSPRAIA
ncbi:MAG: sigma-70 family RNA polymerase sigma factor [Deltaproteobacteria bacterium]|nr:sigma-70 family RNA polymerase sigma factor [Deltaproteobacteria bacterium]